MIRYKDFGIIPTEFGFDLVRFTKSKKLGSGTFSNPTGEEYLRQVDIGYGYTFEGVLKKISHLMAIENLPDDPTLRDYINQYKNCVDEVSKLIGQ